MEQDITAIKRILDILKKHFFVSETTKKLFLIKKNKLKTNAKLEKKIMQI